MAAWGEEEKDSARHRQEKREATRLGKLQSHTEAYSRKFAKRHPLAWPTSRTNPCTDAKRIETTCVTPTCVAPRHVDAPSYLFIYFIFLRTSSARGGWDAARLFFFFFSPLFSRPRAGFATVKVVFFRVGNQCAECEKQQQQQQQRVGH